jgi:microsomal dipeptidase-like Zn-dependent dipeptidase
MMPDPAAAALLDRARALHRRIIAFDSHVDLPLDFGAPGRPADADGPGQFDLPKAARGGLAGVVLTVHATAARPSPEAMDAGRRELETRYAAITGIARDFPDRAGIARTPAELRALAGAGKLAIVIGFQNAFPLGEDLSQLDAWAARGVRQLAFTFIGNNLWADSARPYPYVGGALASGGLSALGKAAVRRLNQLGVIVDVSQLSSPALADVLSTSRAPVVASHSAVRGLVDVDRNLSDAELRAIRDGGGVVQIVAFAPYLRPLDEDMQRQLRAHWQDYGLAPPTSLAAALSVNDPETADWPDERFWTFLHEFHEILRLDRPIADVGHHVDAIDYAVARIGIDHVGIASDFNHAGGVVGWADAGESHNVTAELIRRGYGEPEIAKLWGENFLRVWSEVQDRATAAFG